MRCPACPVPPDRDCRHDDVSPNTPGRGYWTDRVLLASGLESRVRDSVARVRVVHDPPARDRPTVAEMWDRLMLVRSCDYRGPVVHRGCSCSRVCGLGKGRAMASSDATAVTDADCQACVSEVNTA
jgi:hypothetical protein